MVRKVAVIIIILVFSYLLLGEVELRPYRLIHADSLSAVKKQGSYITLLHGNVHFFYGDTEFFTNIAYIYEARKIVKMIGDVRVYEDSLSLQAKEVEYLRKEEKLKLLGDVFFREDHSDGTWRTFQADKIEYLREERDFQAWDNIDLYDSRENMTGKCGYLTYSGDEGFGYMREQPLLTFVQEDSLQIKAERIEYYDEYKKIVAIFEVETILTDYLLTSDFLIYFSEQEKAIYRGEPHLYSELFDAEASEVAIFFLNNVIDNAVLQDSCLVEYKTTEDGKKENWVRSDDMEFVFKDEIISECRALNNITSNYIQRDDPGKKQDYLENSATGQELIMYMDDEGIINLIKLWGNIAGKYTFQE